MKIALIDYNHPVDGFANRDQTGGFGSGMHADGIVGKMISKIKKNTLRVPILTLAYLNAIGRKHGHQVVFYTDKPTDEDITIIASSMLHSHHEIELAKEIRKKLPNTKIGFIGPFSGEFPEKFEPVADFIIKGEPEETFELICKEELEPKGLLVTKNKVDINALPFPNWDGFDIESYGYSPALPRKPFLTIQANRGCPFACEFCPYLVMQDTPLRARTSESVVSEIKYLIERYKIKSLLFRDITWSMSKQNSKRLCRAIIAENFDLDIGVETRADTLDSELIALMAQAGIKSVNLGIESPNDKIVDASGRKPIIESKIETVIHNLEASGIEIQAFYIIGLLDDTEESVRQTIKYSHKLNTYTAQFCVLTPFPGTKTFQELEDRLLTRDFSQYTEYDPVVHIDGLTPERTKALLNLAFNSYYMRPRWLAKHGIKAASSLIKPFLS